MVMTQSMDSNQVGSTQLQPSSRSVKDQCSHSYAVKRSWDRGLGYGGVAITGQRPHPFLSLRQAALFKLQEPLAGSSGLPGRGRHDSFTSFLNMTQTHQCLIRGLNATHLHLAP